MFYFWHTSLVVLFIAVAYWLGYQFGLKKKVKVTSQKKMWKLLKSKPKQEVEDKLDHKNLNLDVKEFKSINPTAENICIFIYNKIKPKLDPNLDLEITLYETPRNFVKYSGS